MKLKPREIHIWRSFLDHSVGEIHQFISLLSPDEKTRAERYKFQLHQHRFIVSRATLRIILGEYLGRSPDQLRFDYLSYGKPILTELSDVSLCFNVSHAQDLAVYALALDCQLGIDLEWIQELTEMDQIAQNFFTKGEVEILQNSPISEKNRVFFAIWTAKEAYLKATGEGLYGLSNVEVNWTPEKSLKFVRLSDHLSGENEWILHQFSPVENTISHVAVLGQNWRFIYCF